MDATLLAELTPNQQRRYEDTARTGARPSNLLLGFQTGGQLASISISRPNDLRDLLARYTAAGLLLDTLGADTVALLTGDEFAAPMLDAGEVTSDLDTFTVVLLAGQETAGTLIPYRYNRRRKRITWQPARPLVASPTRGLWAEAVVPVCFARKLPLDPATVTDLIALNQQHDNDVRLLSPVSR